MHNINANPPQKQSISNKIFPTPGYRVLMVSSPDFNSGHLSVDKNTPCLNGVAPAKEWVSYCFSASREELILVVVFATQTGEWQGCLTAFCD